VKEEIFLDFIQGLLEYDPLKRLTCFDALNHPFLRPLISSQFLHQTMNVESSLMNNYKHIEIKQHLEKENSNSINIEETYIHETKEDIYYLSSDFEIDENHLWSPKPTLDIESKNLDPISLHSEIQNEPISTQKNQEPNYPFIIDLLTSSKSIEKESIPFTSSPNKRADVSPRKFLDHTLGSLVDDILKSVDSEMGTKRKIPPDSPNSMDAEVNYFSSSTHLIKSLLFFPRVQMNYF
jgi:serine/threonine protein kinase